MYRLAILFAIFLSFQVFAQDHPEPVTLKPGTEAIDFKLKGVNGEMYSLASFENDRILVIIFSAPHCPTAQAYEDRIKAIQNDYRVPLKTKC